MADRPLKYRELIKRLKQFGIQEDRRRGKGSERRLVRIVGGRRYSTTTKYHNENDEKPRGVITTIRRRLLLTARDGVSDEEFYGD